jgi:hypothetical protein
MESMFFGDIARNNTSGVGGGITCFQVECGLIIWLILVFCQNVLFYWFLLCFLLCSF